MRRQVLPWESVPGQKYFACDTIQRKGWVTVGGWILVVCLLLGGIVTRWRIALVFGLLYLLALVMRKDVAVTERGLEIYYDMRLTTHYDIWRWSDIFAVTHEPDPRNTAQTILYFSKGDRTKRFLFAKSDAEGVLKLAKSRNAGVQLYDGTKTREKARKK